jgi:hypothetical protein
MAKTIARDGKKKGNHRMQKILSLLRKNGIYPDAEGQSLRFCELGFYVFMVNRPEILYAEVTINPLSENEREALKQAGMNDRSKGLFLEFKISGEPESAARQVLAWLKKAAKAVKKTEANYMPLKQ